jgi:hypothetical protein
VVMCRASRGAPDSYASRRSSAAVQLIRDRGRSPRVAVAVVLIVLFATIATRADAQTGRIAGTVTDDNGRAVPWTSITATCGDVSATATTDISGRFEVDSVPVGPCRILVVTPSSEVVVRYVMVPAGGTAAASVEVSIRDQPKRSSAERLPGTMLAFDNAPINAESSLNRIRLSDQWWAGGAFQSDTIQPLAGFGSTWAATMGMTHTAAGMQVTANATARRGYDLPLFMVQPLGSNELVRSAGPSIVSGSRSAVIWDTELRIRRRLKTYRAGHVDFVGEGLNLLNLNGSTDLAPISPTLTSRTFRFGLVFTF